MECPINKIKMIFQLARFLILKAKRRSKVESDMKKIKPSRFSLFTQLEEYLLKWFNNRRSMGYVILSD